MRRLQAGRPSTVAAASVYVGNGLLYALRGRDGVPLWSFPADVTSDPVETHGVIYVLGANNAADGKPTRSGRRAVLT